MVKRTLLYVLYVAIIAGLVLVIVLAFQSKPASSPSTSLHKGSSSSQSSSSNSPNASHSSSSNTSPQNAKSSSTSSATSNSQSASASSKNTASSTTSQNLSNTGPGDVVALFAVSVAVGALGFTWYQRKKLLETA